VITVELVSATLNQVGFVTDYRDLDSIKEFIDKSLDHRDLNEVLEINPTAESLAKLIFTTFRRKYPQLVSVEVSETPKTTARYTPDHD
jgi:6-pyruvoyltetrahydropterin/6-carboxytetrahydropterin synthase